MLGLAVGIVLLCAAMWFVLLPILKPRAEPAGEPVDVGADPDDDLSPRAVALRALTEIEFDKATGKLSPEDYESLKARYTREAVNALRLGDGAPASPQPPKPAPKPVIPLSSKHVATPALACPVHGVRDEVGAAFCADCGRRLGLQDGDRVCTKCGTLLEPGSRFCGRCGSRVAA